MTRPGFIPECPVAEQKRRILGHKGLNLVLQIYISMSTQSDSVHTPADSNDSNCSSEEAPSFGDILDSESQRNSKAPWCRLNQTDKIAKLGAYASALATEKQLTDSEEEKLRAYLATALDKKRLQRARDVQYDQDTGIVRSVPALVFCGADRRFTLRRSDRRSCTTKCLGPGRTRKRPPAKKIEGEP